jgi:hypothetical protein
MVLRPRYPSQSLADGFIDWNVQSGFGSLLPLHLGTSSG